MIQRKYGIYSFQVLSTSAYRHHLRHYEEDEATLQVVPLVQREQDVGALPHQLHLRRRPPRRALEQV